MSTTELPEKICPSVSREVFPVDEVAADGVSPVHVAPLRSVGVVLEIQVIFAVFVNQTVSVVHPAVERRVMIDGTIIVGIGGIESVGQVDAVPADGVSSYAADGHSGFLGSLRQGEGHVILYAVYSQTHVHGHVGGAARDEFHLAFVARLLDREDKVSGWVCDVNDGERVALVFQADAVALRLAGCQCSSCCQSHCQVVEKSFHGSIVFERLNVQIIFEFASPVRRVSVMLHRCGWLRGSELQAGAEFDGEWTNVATCHDVSGILSGIFLFDKFSTGNTAFSTRLVQEVDHGAT